MFTWSSDFAALFISHRQGLGLIFPFFSRINSCKFPKAANRNMLLLHVAIDHSVGNFVERRFSAIRTEVPSKTRNKLVLYS